MKQVTGRPLRFVGSSKDDFKSFSKEITGKVGRMLRTVQNHGARPYSAKPLKGFGGASVLEIVENDRGGTYRIVYTIKFPKAVFVLHCFQKKSKHGIKTPANEINLIHQRLKMAAQEYKEEFS